jgi:hypothetical protein
MSTDAAPIFDAALGLPEALRADFAAKLIESLDNDATQAPNRTPDEWDAIIKSRSDAIHRGETRLVDGQEVADMLQEVVDRASRQS